MIWRKMASPDRRNFKVSKFPVQTRQLMYLTDTKATILYWWSTDGIESTLILDVNRLEQHSSSTMYMTFVIDLCWWEQKFVCVNRCFLFYNVLMRLHKSFLLYLCQLFLYKQITNKKKADHLWSKYKQITSMKQADMLKACLCKPQTA